MSWATYSVGDLCEVFDGPHATPAPSTEGPIYLGITSIRPDGSIDLENSKRISYEDYPKWTKRVVPQEGDVVFSYEANLSSFAIIPRGFEGCLGRRMAIMRPDREKVLPRFLYYYLLSPKWKGVIAQKTVLGATVNRIPITTYPSFPIEVPDLEEQRRIAGILATYDSLIENNRKQITLLEEAAQRLYKEWFIDLRFPGYEKTEIDSETGTPKNWNRCKTNDVFTDITIGKTPSRERKGCFVAKGVPWFSVSDLGKEGLFAINSSESLAEDAIDEFKVKVVPAGTILLSFKLTLGRVSIATQEAATNEAIAHFRPSSNELRNYTYLYLKTFPYETLGSTSSISKAINSKIVKSIPFVLPDTKLLKEFDAIVGPLFETAFLCRRQLEYAKEARNRLLPRLMSDEMGL